MNSPPASPNNEIKPPLLPPKQTRINSFIRKPNCSVSEQCPKLLTESRFDSLKKHHNTAESNNSDHIRITENTKEISVESGILNSFKEIISDNNTVNFNHEANDNHVVLRQKLYKVRIFSINIFSYLMDTPQNV